MSDVYRDRERKAAKDHRCCECDTLIAKGSTYIYASGVWDGSGWSAKFCKRCNEVRGKACKYQRYDPDECPPIPGLAQWLVDSLDDLHDLKRNAEIIEAGGKILSDLLAKGQRAY